MALAAPAALLALALAGCAAQPRNPAVHMTLWSDRYDRIEYGKFVRLLLQAHAFDRLDSLADSLQRCDSRFDDGSSRLFAFYFFGMRDVIDPKDPVKWENQLDEIREWQDARPQSVHAPVALAEALIGRGWAARGGTIAFLVTHRGMRGFAGDLMEAHSILDQCATMSQVSPSWYDAMLEVMHGLEADQATYDSVYDEAVRKFPAYAHFYLARSWYLQPRWYGRPGDWERAATETSPDLPDSVRDEIYARIVVLQSTYVDSVFKDSPGIDWDRTRRGLETWQREYPASPLPTNALARFASQTGHDDVARAAFQQLGNNVHVDIWDADAFVQAKKKVLPS
jgi:hypothetical protein